MYRFFVKEDNIKENRVKITGDDYNHISKSLRLQPGDKIIICDGRKNDYLVQLSEFGDNIIKAEIKNKIKNKNEPVINISLAQALPKKNNMDLIAQKATEIGFKKLIPLLTERTIVKLTAKKEKKKIKRWQRITREAAKQSQRGIIPVVNKVLNLKGITRISSDYDLVLLYRAEENLSDIKQILDKKGKSTIKDILILIGPEGGFSKDEVEYITDKTKAFSVTLGPRILRTETAGLVAMTTILYEFDQLK